MIFFLSTSNGAGLLMAFSLNEEPLSLGSSNQGRNVSGVCSGGKRIVEVGERKRWVF